MTFISVDLTDWKALFYIGKWILLGILIGIIIGMIYESRKKKREEEK